MKLVYACVLLATFSSTTFSQPVQKWVDDKGKVYYGAPPPGAATKQAMTKGTVSAAGTTPSRNAAQKSTGTTQPPSGAPSTAAHDAYIKPQIDSLQRELERTQRDAQGSKQR